jgi:hypothetical protein
MSSTLRDRNGQRKREMMMRETLHSEVHTELRQARSTRQQQQQ